MARINGEYVIDPTFKQLEEADMDVMVAATYDNIMMVEGEMKEVSEADLLGAMKAAHDEIKKHCKIQMELMLFKICGYFHLLIAESTDYTEGGVEYGCGLSGSADITVGIAHGDGSYVMSQSSAYSGHNAEGAQRKAAGAYYVIDV